jgi:hypothetical protein
MLALALLSGCTGNLIAGVPFDDAGDEFSIDDAAATAVIVQRDAGAAVAADAGASGSGTDTTVGDAARPPMDARAPGGGQAEVRDATPRAPTADAGQGGATRADASSPPPPPPPPASPSRDLTTDRAKFLGSPRCDEAGALLCDDFESEAAGAGPDSAVWSAPFGNVPKIDSTRAARGSKSLYFELAAGTPGHIEERKTFPAARNSVFGRMFVWIDELPTAPAFAYWTLVSALGSNNPAEVRLSGQLDPSRGNGNYFAIGSDHGESGDWATAGQEPQSKVRARDWICLEWLFKGDSSETRVWIDGVEQTSLRLSSSEYRPGDQEAGKRFTHPQFDKLRVGWWLYQLDAQPSPAKLWVDEVIVDDERIGCVL